MKNEPKILFISGSPRNGNTSFILSEIFNSIGTGSKELVFLKDKNIESCKGCLFCHNEPSCTIKDDMEELLTKMKSADIFVIGTPNYFDNVSGLMKNFIDRCHPFYKEKIIRGKKVLLVFVGGGKNRTTKKYLNLSFFGFIKYLKLKLINSYSFKALNPKDLTKKDKEKKFQKIVRKINSLC